MKISAIQKSFFLWTEFNYLFILKKKSEKKLFNYSFLIDQLLYETLQVIVKIKPVFSDLFKFQNMIYDNHYLDLIIIK